MSNNQCMSQSFSPRLFLVKYFVISSSFLQKMFSLKVSMFFEWPSIYAQLCRCQLSSWFVLAAYWSRLAVECRLFIRLVAVFLIQHQRCSARVRVLLEVSNESNRHAFDAGQSFISDFVVRFHLRNDRMFQSLEDVAKAPSRIREIYENFLPVRG